MNFRGFFECHPIETSNSWRNDSGRPLTTRENKGKFQKTQGDFNGQGSQESHAENEKPQKSGEEKSLDQAQDHCQEVIPLSEEVWPRAFPRLPLVYPGGLLTSATDSIDPYRLI